MATKPQLSRSITAFKQLCDDAGTPYAVSCRKAIEKGGLEELERVRQAFSPTAYHSPGAFAVDYLIHSYISKLDVPKDIKRLDEECLSGFRETESRNRIWNRKLRTTLSSKDAESLIFSVRRKIRAVMGDPDRFKYSFLDYCEWGPGATFSLRGVDATLNNKILEPKLSITAKAIPYFLAYVQTEYSWFAARTGHLPGGPVTWLPSNFEVVRGERFSTAPKKWNKRRTISIQPTANLFLQKGMGTYVRKRLKRVGIDLDDQSRNQIAASKAYVDRLATLDLKEASNSMLVEHIRLYFDEAWVQIFEDLRCPEIRLPDGSWHRLELHSAMGNGYTFEVESLLFWAIAQSVADMYTPGHNVLVYGDDVIVPQECASQVIEVLEANGFRVNPEKSFTSGNFYESCGKHYFQGIDVTPIYEKSDIGDLALCIRSYNRLYRWLRRHGCTEQFACTLRFLELRAYSALRFEEERRNRTLRRLSGRSGASRRVRSPFMPYQAYWVPGDGGLITEDLRYLPDANENGIWSFKLLVAQPVKIETDGWSVLSVELRRAAQRGEISFLSNVIDAPATNGTVTPRDRVRWKIVECRFYRHFYDASDLDRTYLF